MSVVGGKRGALTIGKRNIPLIQNHHWLKLGAINSIYSNQICRKKIVRGVRNRFVSRTMRIWTATMFCPEMLM
jgi:hypothetical protein